jgi:tRNA(Ile)-lysidine synthase
MPRVCEFEQKLAESWPPHDWHEVTVLLAVSGGADSVALACALESLRGPALGRLIVAHFNHRLRGEEADADERFVVDLARRLGLACEVWRERVDTQAITDGDGLEAAARTVRYAFLQAAAERLGARYVATAHTADDQAETVLHHVIRGTGLAGLAGIPRARLLGPAVTLIRPLLAIRREDALNYLAELNQPFRNDGTNAQTRFTRNRLRHELLPKLSRDFNPRVVESLLRLGRLAGEACDVVSGLVEPLAARCVRTEPGGPAGKPAELQIDCRPLADPPRYVVREVLIAAWRAHGYAEQAMGFDQWDQLAELAQGAETAAVRRAMFPGCVLASREGNLLTVRNA